MKEKKGKMLGVNEGKKVKEERIEGEEEGEVGAKERYGGGEGKKGEGGNAVHLFHECKEGTNLESYRKERTKKSTKEN